MIEHSRSEYFSSTDKTYTKRSNGCSLVIAAAAVCASASVSDGSWVPVVLVPLREGEIIRIAFLMTARLAQDCAHSRNTGFPCRQSSRPETTHWSPWW